MNNLGDVSPGERRELMGRIKRAYENPPYSDLKAWPHGCLIKGN